MTSATVPAETQRDKGRTSILFVYPQPDALPAPRDNSFCGPLLKGLIVEVLCRVSWQRQATLARIVRWLWPGFRDA